MAPVHEDICIGLFAFVVNLISSKKQPNKHNFEISQIEAVPYPEFFKAYQCMYQDFNKSIGEHTVRQTDGQTEKTYSSI